MHPVVDLRSDTVTRPSQAMREAMMRAEVGDTVYDEDPTVRALEARVAGLLGKEAAMYVATGTMANSLGLALTAGPGDEIIMEEDAHPHHYEGGGPPAFRGFTVRTVKGANGILRGRDVEAMLHPGDFYRPRQKGISLENTHNRGGGTIYPLENIKEIASIAREHGLRMHLDGARLWNASVATGIPMAAWAAEFDTVSVCFSKGLGAPVGSVLVGSRRDIEECWHLRHMLGGTWRQAGILAAGALHALEHNLPGLAVDHENASFFARGLGERCDLEVVNPVETNMVYFTCPDPEDLVRRAGARGVLLGVARPGVIRAVTHLDVDREDMETALDVIRECL